MISGEWVGQLTLSNRRKFMRIEISQELSGSPDLPERLQFR